MMEFLSLLLIVRSERESGSVERGSVTLACMERRISHRHKASAVINSSCRKNLCKHTFNRHFVARESERASGGETEEEVARREYKFEIRAKSSSPSTFFMARER
jgi:hypothetical protein